MPKKMMDERGEIIWVVIRNILAPTAVIVTRAVIANLGKPKFLLILHVLNLKKTNLDKESEESKDDFGEEPC